MNTLSKRAWVGGICIIFLLATNSVFIRLYLQTPPAHQYTGLGFEAVADKLVYYSMILQGAQGALFMQNVHTSEPQYGLLFSPHWYLIGQTMNVAHIPIALSYHLYRVLASLGFLFVLWKLVQHLFLDFQDRLGALTATLFASGLGWFYFILHPEIIGTGVHWLRYFNLKPADLYVTELGVFMNTVQSPLFIISHALIILIWLLFMSRSSRGVRTYSALAVVPALLIAIHPYDSLIVLSVTGSLAVWEYVSDRSVEGLKRWAFVILGAGVAILYHAISLLSELALKGWLVQNLAFSPSLGSYLWALGITGPASLLGIYFFVSTREQSPWWRLVIIWVICIALAIYLPVGLNRRFSNTWLIATTLLGYYGIRTLLHRLTSFIAQGAIIMCCALLLFSGTVYQLAQYTLYQPNLSEKYNYYLDQYVLTSFSALKERAGHRDVLLANEPFLSMLVAAYVPTHLYVGHPDQTVNFAMKEQLAQWFFSEPVTEAALARRKEFLVTNNITSIMVYKPSLHVSYEWLDTLPGVERIHDSPMVRIFKVTL